MEMECSSRAPETLRLLEHGKNETSSFLLRTYRIPEVVRPESNARNDAKPSLLRDYHIITTRRVTPAWLLYFVFCRTLTESLSVVQQSSIAKGLPLGAQSRETETASASEREAPPGEMLVQWGQQFDSGYR